MILPVMAQYAKMKGLDILSASDFTHPLWFKEISAQLEEADDGIYKLKGDKRDMERRTYFILSTEIASIYKQGEKLRRVHNLIFAPSLETIAKINGELVKRGCNLNADGRPIIGLSSKNLLELILGIDARCFLIPCHIWTPHFGIYGSASGFDSLHEAFGDLADNIYGIETGLSSDPDMNWGISELKNRSILSFSDAHSPAKMGREGTVFELEEISYLALKDAIMRPSQLSNRQPRFNRGLLKTDNRILYTIEFYPEEGKYHFSGHRSCKVSYGPEQIREKGTICPVCHRRMTEGVLLRVQQLADPKLFDRVHIKQNEQRLAWHTDVKKEQPPYVKLVPLLEIIAESMHSTVASQKVKDMFTDLCASFGSELEVLVKTPIDEIAKVGGERVAEGLERIRNGNLVITPGYDGEYGKVTIWGKEEDAKYGSINEEKSQLTLDF